MKRYFLLFGLAIALLVLNAPVSRAADEAFGDWVLHCAEVSGGEKACALHQRIIAQETKLRVASIAIARNKDSKELRLSVILPLGLDLPSGVSGKLGDATLTFTLQTCVKRGCIASTVVDETLLAALKGTDRFTATFTMRGVKDPTTLPVSLKGLEGALAALESR